MAEVIIILLHNGRCCKCVNSKYQLRVSSRAITLHGYLPLWNKTDDHIHVGLRHLDYDVWHTGGNHYSVGIRWSRTSPTETKRQRATCIDAAFDRSCRRQNVTTTSHDVTRVRARHAQNSIHITDVPALPRRVHGSRDWSVLYWSDVTADVMVIDRRRALVHGHAAASQCTVVLNGSVWSDSRYVLLLIRNRFEFTFCQCTGVWRQDGLYAMLFPSDYGRCGDAENAGMENAGPWKVRGWKTRDWQTRDQIFTGRKGGTTVYGTRNG